MPSFIPINCTHDVWTGRRAAPAHDGGASDGELTQAIAASGVPPGGVRTGFICGPVSNLVQSWRRFEGVAGLMRGEIGKRFGAVLIRRRFLIQVAIDSCAWALGLSCAALFRFDLVFRDVPWRSVAIFAALAAVLYTVLGFRCGLFVHRWAYGTFEELAAVVKATALTTLAVVVLALAVPVDGRVLPVSVAVSSAFLALGFMSAARFIWRIRMDRLRRAGPDREPIVIIGAGEAGRRIVLSMLRSGPYEPVALLDDNPDLRNLRVKGVPVLGTSDDFATVTKLTGARKVLIAIPSASGEVLRSITARTDRVDTEVFVLPAVHDLIGAVGIGDIRPIEAEDLLGRRELNLNVSQVADYLTGRRVLVTGAGGSIGSELCRQISRFAPAELVMLDRDESALQDVQLSIEGRGLLDSRNIVVGCIRDRQRMDEVFAEHRPEVVFHAAALKHLPLLEMHPEEGWKTNVWGTQNLLSLSGRYEVQRFVNISTDKAAAPTSVLGLTKRFAERLTAQAAIDYSGTYLSVRFGNVLGSRGSVIPLFRAQIAAGGPVTVTDPEVTRFLMTIPEACELVVQAGALEHNGRVLILDMGEPVRIDDLARRLIADSPRKVSIVYTGLRPGEKLHEVLTGSEEDPIASGHPLISAVDVPPMSARAAELVDPRELSVVVDLRVPGSDSGADSAPTTPAGDPARVGHELPD